MVSRKPFQVASRFIENLKREARLRQIGKTLATESIRHVSELTEHQGTLQTKIISYWIAATVHLANEIHLDVLEPDGDTALIVLLDLAQQHLSDTTAQIELLSEVLTSAPNLRTVYVSALTRASLCCNCRLRTALEAAELSDLQLTLEAIRLNIKYTLIMYLNLFGRRAAQFRWWSK